MSFVPRPEIEPLRKSTQWLGELVLELPFKDVDSSIKAAISIAYCRQLLLAALAGKMSEEWKDEVIRMVEISGGSK